MVVSESVRRFWLEAARSGHAPSVVDVMQRQYDLLAPWHIRETLWRDLRGLGSWGGKRKSARTLSRDHGKSIGVGGAILYAAEYVVPFLPGLRHENRRINVIGRDVDHLRKENMDTLETMICSFAPWLKTTDRELWNDPVALKEYQIKSRSWTTTQKDLTNGVSIRAFGFRQSVRGGHVPYTVLDDIVDDEHAHHGLQHYNKILSAVVPSVINGGLIQKVGTPVDDNDVWKYISQEPDWNYESFPAIDEDGSLNYKQRNMRDVELGYLPESSITQEEDWSCLWPLRMGYASLMSVRGSLPQTELAFLKEYMMKRAAAWNLLVHPDHYKASKRDDLHYYASNTSGESYCFMGIDPSTLARSNFVIWVAIKVAVRDQKGNITHSAIRPLYREKIEVEVNDAPEVRKQKLLLAMDRIRVIFHRFNPRKVVVEGNGFQYFIEPFLEDRDARFKGRVETVTLTSNKHMDDGWPMIRTAFELGHIEMPYGPTPNEMTRLERGEIEPGDYEARRITDDFWNELSGVKYHEARILEDKQIKTDQVAAFYFLLRAADYVPDTVDFGGGALDGAKDLQAFAFQQSKRADPEMARGNHSRSMSAWDRVQRAHNMSRR